MITSRVNIETQDLLASLAQQPLMKQIMHRMIRKSSQQSIPISTEDKQDETIAELGRKNKTKRDESVDKDKQQQLDLINSLEIQKEQMIKQMKKCFQTYFRNDLHNNALISPNEQPIELTTQINNTNHQKLSTTKHPKTLQQSSPMKIIQNNINLTGNSINLTSNNINLGNINIAGNLNLTDKSINIHNSDLQLLSMNKSHTLSSKASIKQALKKQKYQIHCNPQTKTITQTSIDPLIIPMRLTRNRIENDTELQILPIGHQLLKKQRIQYKIKMKQRLPRKKPILTKLQRQQLANLSIELPSTTSQSPFCLSDIIEPFPLLQPLVPHSQISFYKEIRAGTMYFISNFLSIQCQPNSKNLKMCINPVHVTNFFQQSIRTIALCSQIAPLYQVQLKRIKLNRNFQRRFKKTLVLDMDQTLIHSQPPNQKINRTIYPYSFYLQGSLRHYSIRNHVASFLQNMSKNYYIVVFTSAVQNYADQILNKLDPQGKFIQHRLYRQHCFSQGEMTPFIKDLRILNRDLSQVVIVDNSVYAFWFQIDNGIPILPFEGVQDRELEVLEMYLNRIANVDDVRPINRRMFQVHLYSQFSDVTSLLKAYVQQIVKQLKSYEQQQLASRNKASQLSPKTAKSDLKSPQKHSQEKSIPKKPLHYDPHYPMGKPKRIIQSD